jgi:CDP-diacylglycerol pyrophosphatase
VRRRRWVLMLVSAVVALTLGVLAQRQQQRDRLRMIVQQQCVPHWLAEQRPAPCSRVTLQDSGPDPQGYAVLHDRKGGVHFLLIPTRTTGGIESLPISGSAVPNYFAAAWSERALLTEGAPAPLPRSAIGLAVNQRSARSQDQLHIHMSCLRPELARALQQQRSRIGPAWSALEFAGHRYQALRIMGAELGAADPVRLLAEGVAGARAALADYTLLLAGEQFAEGPGFVLLASANAPGAELLLDPRCALAR